MPSKPADGCSVRASPDSPLLQKQCLGPALNETLLGHCIRTVKNLIMALMPYCLWRHKAMFLHEFQGYTSMFQHHLSSIFLWSAKTDQPYMQSIFGSGGLCNSKMEHVKSSMVPSRDCLPPTNLYCLVCGSWGLYLRDTNNFQLFSPPPVKRLLLLQTFSFFSHKHLCCECAAHDGFSAMFLFLNKERLVDSSQPLNDDLSLKMLFVSL